MSSFQRTEHGVVGVQLQHLGALHALAAGRHLAQDLSISMEIPPSLESDTG